MRAELDRFGLARYRRLTGALEVMLVASVGLALLMLLGVIARVRVRDPILEILPATVLLMMNGYLFFAAWGMVPAS